MNAANGLTDTDVLIVGAGPAGMVTAALLQRLGLTVRIIERHPSRLTRPKAHVVGPVTLDICQQAGFDVDRMIAEAIPPEWDQFVRFRTTLFGEEIGRIPFERQPREWTARPRINLSQPQFEAILEEDLSRRPNVEVVYGRWTNARTEDRRVVSTVLVDDQQVEFTSRYVIGADGANSSVREALSMPVQILGEPDYQITVHVVSDMRDQLSDTPAVMYALIDPENVTAMVIHSLSDPSHHNWMRWVFLLPYDGETMPAQAEVTAKARKIIGSDDIPFEVLALSPWVRTSAVAERYNVGPVFLVGDAAHRLSPSGGLGLNTAIQDGANLAWKLAAVVNGWAQEPLLDTYSAERRPIAVANTNQSHKNAIIHIQAFLKLASVVRDGTLHTMPKTELEQLVHENWIGFNSPGLQLGYGYGPGQEVQDPTTFTPSAVPGRRLPHVQVHTADTSRPIIDFVNPAGFTVFTHGKHTAWQQICAGCAIPVVLVDVAGKTENQDWLELTGLSREGAALVVRPDGHIAAHAIGPDSWPEVYRMLEHHLRDGQQLGTLDVQ